MTELKRVSTVNSRAEELFIDVFCEAFGPDKADKLFVQYPFVDIYGSQRFIDFALKNLETKIAIEIDGETYHNPKNISDNKYYDDLLKQNSMIYQDWKLYRFAYNQLVNQPDKVKDELILFLGETPFFTEYDNYLPEQQGKTIELRDYQEEAVSNLHQIREDGDSIALLYHATGIGKTVTACSDAKDVNGRTLFLVNALKLADQAEKTFATMWPSASRSFYNGSEKDNSAKVVFATVQSVSRNLYDFSPGEFDYIIVDECHHAASSTYQQIFGYFTPKFILGLSATPERTDGEDMLSLFKNVAHKMDLKTAIERDILASIRCIRVKTDIDMSDVRINGIRYNSYDLESKLFMPERNQLIADTYVNYVKDKKTVIFCASVSHAEVIAELLRKMNVMAECVSGRDRIEVRNRILERYETGDIQVLCACDLLNEGWDSPHTQVLFMARPTMSKTIYMQQLGRGTRKCEGKEDLLVFDFVDNANMFNMPYSLHRLLDINTYHPLEYVLAPEKKRKWDEDLFRKGEKPEAWVELPVNTMDYQVIDLFNWQNEVKGMLSTLDFVRMVDVQAETVERYIHEGKITPDLSVPISENRKFNYFRRESVISATKQFGWDLITVSNMKEKFMDFVERMDMSFSYKPVLLLALFDQADDKGRAHLSHLASFFIDYYETRKEQGLVAEKANSIYQKGGYTEKDVERNILTNPFKRFADMTFLRRSKDVSCIEFNPIIWKKLSIGDKKRITSICEEKLELYYQKLHVTED